MFRLIVIVLAAAALWYGYTHLGQPLNLNNAVQGGQNSFKQEKTIDRVIQGRQNMHDRSVEASDF